MKKLLALLVTFVVFSAHAGVKKEQLPHIYYVNFPVVSAQGELSISAQYRLPRGLETPAPAIVILHSSGGIDSTGSFYARKLNKLGIATLELDMWAARGLAGGTAERPATIQETIPDAYSALAYLATQPEIDPTRIGVMGFSWGGVVSMLTATEQYAPPAEFPFAFAAHIAHYPVCWVYNIIPGFEFTALSGAPVMIQAAELDDYDLPSSCQTVVDTVPTEQQELVTFNFYEGAYHGWDRLEPTLVVEDIFANLGQGGLVTLAPDEKAAKKSRRKVVKFLKQNLNVETD